MPPTGSLYRVRHPVSQREQNGALMFATSLQLKDHRRDDPGRTPPPGKFYSPLLQERCFLF